jgi:hypothetical protein
LVNTYYDKFVIEGGLKTSKEEERIYPVLVLEPNDGALSLPTVDTIPQFYIPGVYMVRVIEEIKAFVHFTPTKLYWMLFQDRKTYKSEITRVITFGRAPHLLHGLYSGGSNNNGSLVWDQLWNPSQDLPTIVRKSSSRDQPSISISKNRIILLSKSLNLISVQTSASDLLRENCYLILDGHLEEYNLIERKTSSYPFFAKLLLPIMAVLKEGVKLIY